MITNVTGIDCKYSSSIVEVPFDEKSGVSVSDSIIFKDEEGHEEFGKVLYIDRSSNDEKQIRFDSKILRKATANDFQKVESGVERAERALTECKSIIKKLNLEMYAFDARYSFDGSKVNFLFTADERVDFRDLVKELARILKKQIHLRQIGPRDKAKLIGGRGRCGRQLCCNTFLRKMESIGMEMVREQGLESKGSSKLSGACGKLLCCLKYEVEAYRDLKDSLPQIGSFVKLKKSAVPELKAREGQVMALDVLNQKVRVQLSDGENVVVSGAEIAGKSTS